jgi:hypothetical protein
MNPSIFGERNLPRQSEFPPSAVIPAKAGIQSFQKNGAKRRPIQHANGVK